jgi:hypothetical protein
MYVACLHMKLVSLLSLLLIYNYMSREPETCGMFILYVGFKFITILQKNAEGANVWNVPFHISYSITHTHTHTHTHIFFSFTVNHKWFHTNDYIFLVAQLINEKHDSWLYSIGMFSSSNFFSALTHTLQRTQSMSVTKTNHSKLLF